MREKAVFVIKIYENQHGTWQGSLADSKDKEICHFRSALEMLKLMDEVIEKRIAQSMAVKSHSGKGDVEDDGSTVFDNCENQDKTICS